jgi:hypothetical protein
MGATMTNDELILAEARAAVGEAEELLLAADRQLARGSRLYAAAGLAQSEVRIMLQPFLGCLDDNGTADSGTTGDFPEGGVADRDDTTPKFV